MTVILHPVNSFTIVRQIANHTDSNTYYVQAVIRNAYTDVIIATLNLTDKGSQRFHKNWKVPQDPSNQGFYISIVTSVYTDSGYTTKSANYGDEENTYLIQDRVSDTVRGGNGLGMGDLRRIFKEETEILLPKEQKEIEIPDPIDHSSDFKKIMTQITSVKTAIAKLPKKNNDLKPIEKKLENLSLEIQNKDVTPETDLEEVLEAIKSTGDSNEIEVKDIQNLFTLLEEKLPDLIKKNVEEAVTTATPNAMKGATFNIPAQLQPPVQEKPKEEEPLVDINKLAS